VQILRVSGDMSKNRLLLGITGVFWALLYTIVTTFLESALLLLSSEIIVLFLSAVSLKLPQLGTFPFLCALDDGAFQNIHVILSFKKNKLLL
jgi:hypothetical protein